MAEESKNWQCLICGNDNYPSRQFCNRRTCNAPRSLADTNTVSPTASGNATGNWICSTCGNDNYASRQFCNKNHCGLPRQMSVAPDEMKRRGEWKCVCGNINYAERTHCNIRKCGKDKQEVMMAFMYNSVGGMPGMHPGGMLGMPPMMMPPMPGLGGDMGGMGGMGGMPGIGGMPGMGGMPGIGGYGGMPRGNLKRPRGGDPKELNWQCEECGNMNFPHRTQCNMKKCGVPRPTSTITWKCPDCGNENYPSRTRCNMRKCNAPRPDDDGTKKQKIEEDQPIVPADEY